jgi:hypothetical protein
LGVRHTTQTLPESPGKAIKHVESEILRLLSSPDAECGLVMIFEEGQHFGGSVIHFPPDLAEAKLALVTVGLQSASANVQHVHDLLAVEPGVFEMLFDRLIQPFFDGGEAVGDLFEGFVFNGNYVHRCLVFRVKNSESTVGKNDCGGIEHATKENKSRRISLRAFIS